VFYIYMERMRGLGGKTRGRRRKSELTAEAREAILRH